MPKRTKARKQPAATGMGAGKGAWMQFFEKAAPAMRRAFRRIDAERRAAARKKPVPA